MKESKTLSLDAMVMIADGIWVIDEDQKVYEVVKPHAYDISNYKEQNYVGLFKTVTNPTEIELMIDIAYKHEKTK